MQPPPTKLRPRFVNPKQPAAKPAKAAVRKTVPAAMPGVESAAASVSKLNVWPNLLSEPPSHLFAFFLSLRFTPGFFVDLVSGSLGSRRTMLFYKGEPFHFF